MAFSDSGNFYLEAAKCRDEVIDEFPLIAHDGFGALASSKCFSR